MVKESRVCAWIEIAKSKAKFIEGECTWNYEIKVTRLVKIHSQYTFLPSKPSKHHLPFREKWQLIFLVTLNVLLVFDVLSLSRHTFQNSKIVVKLVFKTKVANIY